MEMANNRSISEPTLTTKIYYFAPGVPYLNTLPIAFKLKAKDLLTKGLKTKTKNTSLFSFISYIYLVSPYNKLCKKYVYLRVKNFIVSSYNEM